MDWLAWFDEIPQFVRKVESGKSNREIEIFNGLTEGMYQAFKARMIAETEVVSAELLRNAKLVDMSDG